MGVFPTEAEIKGGATDCNNEIVCGHGQDVGTGGDARALKLEGALARATASNPSPERGRLTAASCSALLKVLEVTKMEVSQLPTIQLWKKRRSMAPAVVGVDSCLWVTAFRTMSENLGQFFGSSWW
ncbi:hypothetical protein JHK82_050214 [Glycine max]|nr:hypothetical protein JHK82_050214 [Glycine max]